MRNEKPDLLRGSLVPRILRTVDTFFPQLEWGIAPPIEQIAGDPLATNQGILSPARLATESENWERAAAGESL